MSITVTLRACVPYKACMERVHVMSLVSSFKLLLRASHVIVVLAACFDDLSESYVPLSVCLFVRAQLKQAPASSYACVETEYLAVRFTTRGGYAY